MLTNKNFSINFFLILFIFILTDIGFAQVNKNKYIKTKSGLEYKILIKGKGQKIIQGHRVFLNYITRIKPDSVFDTNPVPNKPFAFIVNESEGLKAWDEALNLLHIGDSAHFIIPPSLAFGNKKIGKIAANTFIYFEVKIIGQEQAYYNINKAIDSTVLRKGLKKYLISKGTNKKVSLSNLVTLKFTGYIKTIEGKKRIFESSLTNSSFVTFQIGAGRFVKGLDEGIQTMNIGEKANFMVDPELAYGNQKKGIIPANSILFYDIELIKETNPFFTKIITDTIFDTLGLKIVKLSSLSGDSISDEKVVVFNSINYFISKNGNKIILDNTFERAKPIVNRLGNKNLLPELKKAFKYLKKGDTALVISKRILSIDSSQIPIKIKYGQVYYQIEIMDVFSYPFFDTKGKDTIILASGLKYIDVRNTINNKAKRGSHVFVSYTTFVIDEKGNKIILDASRESDRLLDFTLGMGKVIKGFDEGITGMGIGEGRRLIVPYKLAYGENGMPDLGIPKKATVYFDVELISIDETTTTNNK